jgi:hypothetical protein
VVEAASVAQTINRGRLPAFNKALENDPERYERLSVPNVTDFWDKSKQSNWKL